MAFSVIEIFANLRITFVSSSISYSRAERSSLTLMTNCHTSYSQPRHGAGVGGEDAACVSINRVANLDREGDRPTSISFSALFDQIKSAISAERSASFY